MANRFQIAAVLREAQKLESELRLSLRRSKSTPITQSHPLNFNRSAVVSQLRALRQALKRAGVN